MQPVAEPDLGGLKLSFSEWKERVLTHSKLGHPEVEPLQPRIYPAMCVCASGPSLKEKLGALKRLRKQGARIMAVNRAYPFLLRHGIVPDLFAAFDPDEQMVGAVAHATDHTFHLIASQMHPKVFEALKGKKVAIWHAWSHGFERSQDGQRHLQSAEEWNAEWGVRHVMCGGSHIGIHALCLATFLGHFNLHLFGYDGCIRAQGVHAFRQARDEAPTFEIEFDGKKYTLDPALSVQVQEFTEVARIVRHKVKMQFHGPSLLGAIWQKEAA